MHFPLYFLAVLWIPSIGTYIYIYVVYVLTSYYPSLPRFRHRASVSITLLGGFLRLCTLPPPSPVPSLASRPWGGSGPLHDATILLGRRFLQLWLLVINRWRRHPPSGVFRPTSSITSEVPGLSFSLLHPYLRSCLRSRSRSRSRPYPSTRPRSSVLVPVPTPVPTPVTVSSLPSLSTTSPLSTSTTSDNQTGAGPAVKQKRIAAKGVLFPFPPTDRICIINEVSHKVIYIEIQPVTR